MYPTWRPIQNGQLLECGDPEHLGGAPGAHSRLWGLLLRIEMVYRGRGGGCGRSLQSSVSVFWLGTL